MISRSRYWSLVLLVLGIAVTVGPRFAAAQTTTGTPTIAMSPTYPVVRKDDDTNRPTTSSSDLTIALTMTGADCRSSKLKYKFSLTVQNWDVTNQLQVWVSRSTDCSGEYTASSVTRTCWRVEDNVPVVNQSATVELAPSLLLGLDADPNYLGNQRVLTSSCDDPVTGNGRQSLTVYFLVINNANAVATKVTQQMYYSLKGPTAPAINDVGEADQSLHLKWSPLTSQPTEVTYEFYCAPNDTQDDKNCSSSAFDALGLSPAVSSSGTAGSSTGGASSDAGGSSNVAGGQSGTSTGAGQSQTAGAAGTSNSVVDGSSGTTSTNSGANTETVSTAASALEGTAGAGQQSSGASFKKYLCGSRAGKTIGDGYTDPVLKNGTSYAVALGVRDAYGSLGTLSAYECLTPVETETFYEAYKKAQGKAGGGFCNLDRQPNRGTMPIAFLGVPLIGWLRRRRRVKRSDSPAAQNGLNGKH